MDKLYPEKQSVLVDQNISFVPAPVQLEQIKIRPAEHHKKDPSYNKLTSPLQKKGNRILKRSFDIALSSLFTVCILSWLAPLLSILIKLDSKGPVFFLQRRTGFNGKLFTCIKFRSMIVNEDAHLLAEQEDDQRITGLGKWLRKYHIDEFPQFINVLLGHMSVVGPRPYMEIENNRFENLFSEYIARYSVKPGITGFAQSRGNFGPNMNMKKLRQRIYLDSFYIEKWSAAMDMKILLRTFYMMINKP